MLCLGTVSRYRMLPNTANILIWSILCLYSGAHGAWTIFTDVIGAWVFWLTPIIVFMKMMSIWRTRIIVVL